MPKQNMIFAFDFDGVLCDSARETAMSGWRASQNIWHELKYIDGAEFADEFVAIRPLLETGYQAIIIMKLLHEGIKKDDFFANFADLCHDFLQRSKINKEILIKEFGAARDVWLKRDLAGWLATNSFYSHALCDFRKIIAAGHKVFILTTKQERFVIQLLAGEGIDFPLSHLFGLEKNIPKRVILQMLQKKYANAELLFIEDRLPTLLKVTSDKTLDKVKLFFADWGYNTVAEQAMANAENIVVISSLQQII